MPEFFLTADGPKEIPPAVISEGRQAVQSFIDKQGWKPPRAATPPASSPATVTKSPAPDSKET